jgi:membrane-bound lytic murein transglycosylase B
MKSSLLLLVTVLLAAALARPTLAVTGQDFPLWLEDFKRDAAAQGVPAMTIESALAGVTPMPRVLELDERQPESTVTLSEYLAKVVVPARIEQGRKLKVENRRLLHAIGDRYGVPPKTIMALWAIESSFGHAMGDFRVVNSLATLAYDGRRPDLFRAELIAALKIIARGRFGASDLKGSWAGAMGQTQFMPSTYLRYGVPYGHDGQSDIWHNTGDVFASSANYLSSLGWKREESWGREVRLPTRFGADALGLPNRRTIAEWARLGVRRSDGGMLPASSIQASVVAPDGLGGRAFLVYDNFRTIMKWNHSTYFALAVGLLGDAIGN